MARIHSLHIENFRGIKKFDQVFQMKPFICLIGRGDSGKTTILKAISCVLCPNWNISIPDLDFYNADISQSIVIEVVVGDLPIEFIEYNFHEGIKRVRQNLHLFDNITFVDGNSNYGEIVAIYIKRSAKHEITNQTFGWFNHFFAEAFDNLK